MAPSSQRLSVDDLVLDEDTGVLVLPQGGTAAAYRDGAERYLLEALQSVGDVGLFSHELRLKVRDWASLYHLTPYRATILEALGLTARDSKVLELGAGCGAVTRWLGENFDSVHAVEGSLSRAQVARERTREQAGVSVAAANFFDLDFEGAYDLTTLIGVLEYSHLWHPVHGNDPWRAALSNLELSRASLRDDGMLVIAIENKLGLKYLTGAHEDHAAKPFEGIVGYPSRSSAVTWSAAELERLVTEAGFTGCDFYLPFPDYKLAHTMIDASAADPSVYPANWIRTPFPDRVAERTPFYNESLALREIVSAGLLRDLANSFVVLAYNGDRERVRERLGVEGGWVARHYSLDRRPAFCKRTSLERSTGGDLVVRTAPAAPDAAPSPPGLALGQQLSDEPFRPGHQLQFEVLELGAGGRLADGLPPLLVRLRDYLVDSYGTGTNDALGIPLLAGEAMDAVFSNIIVDPETAEWHAIDREWTFRGHLPLDFVLWRGLHDLVAHQSSLLGRDVAARPIEFILSALAGVFPWINRARLGYFDELERYIQYAAGSKPAHRELDAPPQIVQQLMRLAAEPFTLLLRADELRANPGLLAATAQGERPVTHVVLYAPDADAEKTAAELGPLFETPGVAGLEVVLMAVPGTAENEAKLAARVDAVASAGPIEGPLAQLPRLDAPAVEPVAPRPAADRRRVLVAGIYLADRPNTAHEAIASLESDTHEVVQRWIALGGEPADAALQAVTTQVVLERTPKYALLNRILETEDLSSYDYVVLCDDDVLLPERFLDDYLPVQERLGFALTGPARTPNSYIDHEITRQVPGVLARRTRFVEIGPVVCVARRAFEHIFPFDESNGMGWGFENVWTHKLECFGLTLGIVDALPVDHSLRPPVENYSWHEADAGRTAYLAANRHVPIGECMKVLEVHGLDDARLAA